MKSKSTNTAGFASGAVEQRRSSEMGSNASSIAASAASAADLGCEETVEFKTKDGWRIIGTLHIPRSSGRVPGVVLVHGSRHESDAFGQISTPSLADTLSSHGLATLRIDIRGRGASREPQRFHSMAPEQREAVLLDVKAALQFLAQTGVKRNHIGIVGEQDTAGAVLTAAATSKHVVACVLISGRLNRFAVDAFSRTRKPIFCLVSKEDKPGLKDMVDAYLASKNGNSRIQVFDGLAMGTTMFSTWRFEFPNEPPIEEMVGSWLSATLGNRTRKEKNAPRSVD
ncbi:MAG TPA: alpha/beta fold hydrolase [Blastocatellia bacterium]|nr:alpha/beta fold hydrolase [Blastocatellia bacterium]